MLIKKFISTLLYIVLINLLGLSLKAQEIPDDENKKIVVDTIDAEENLLDSNEAYKQQFDTLSKDGEWIKIKKSDFLRDLIEDTGEDLEYRYFSELDIIYVWRPYCSNAYWNPYTNGRWIFSHYGWIWLSDYSWGWGPYNYGRWYCSDLYGWMWLPGRIWGPNWVTWRYYGSYVGWYPRCPRVYWRDYRNQICTNTLFAYAPADWLFVRKNDFTKKIDNTTIVKTSDNTDMLKNSQKEKTAVYVEPGVTKIKYTGPDVNDISKETGEKISPKDVEFTEVAGKSSADKNTVTTFRKGSATSEDNNAKISKKDKGAGKEAKENNSEVYKTDDKNPSSYPGTKKTRSKQRKDSTKEGTRDKGYEGSNESSTTKRDNGSKENNTDKKVERSEPKNESSNDKSPGEIK